ncbi:hypothetical protein PA42_14830 [Pasteurella canis]|uniref:Uncharacterized protein n=1 Tax=Pasteurella canis TaxID=753 RepID=A0ABQ4VIW5_9PAST|nr:hypothetical protein PA42_14830 [Pasteurella canis]
MELSILEQRIDQMMKKYEHIKNINSEGWDMTHLDDKWKDGPLGRD